MKSWIPFWICLGIALLINAISLGGVYLFYNPNAEVPSQYEGYALIAAAITIPAGFMLIAFGALFSIRKNIMILTLLRLVEATLVVILVTLLFPILLIVGGIYLKSKRGIKFSETWEQGPLLYSFFILNVYPIFFVILPEMAHVKELARKERSLRKKGHSEKYVSRMDLGKLRAGDVVLTGSDDWEQAIPIKASNILSAGEEYRYWTHAAIYSGDGAIIEAQVDGRGVTQTPLESFFSRGQEIIVLRHKYVFPEEAAQAVDYCRKVLDRKTAYDWWGVTFYSIASTEPRILDGFLSTDFAERVFNVKNSFFCSELVAEAYADTGHVLFDRRPWRVKPLDFLFNPLFEKVSCDFVREPVSPQG